MSEPRHNGGTCLNEHCCLGGGHNGQCDVSKPNIHPAFIAFGKVVKGTATLVTDSIAWRVWAVKTLNRIDMQNATNEELQKALEDKMRA